MLPATCIYNSCGSGAHLSFQHSLRQWIRILRIHSEVKDSLGYLTACLKILKQKANYNVK